MTKLLDTLTGAREVRVFIPDISLQEATKNEAFVMRIDLPGEYEFLKVLQIEDVLNGIMPMQGRTTLAYAFLVNPKMEATPRRYYLTSLMPDVVFPWMEDLVTGMVHPHGVKDFVICEYIGISTHNGVVITHVTTHVHPENYDQFEDELKENGYRIVRGKRYDKGLALASLYKQHATKVADGKVDQPVPPPGPGVAGEDSARPEADTDPAPAPEAGAQPGE